jgi:hypothetical protein
MNMVDVLRRSALCAVLMVGVVFAGYSSAFALSPWWHLMSSSRPTDLRPGSARDAVQKVTVSATGGEFLVGVGGQPERVVKFDAPAPEFQSILEELYGRGNVQVSGGPGDETGSKPYVVTFMGELADQPIAPIFVENLFFTIQLNCQAATGPGCTRSVTDSVVTTGRPDGEIVVTAANLGDAPVEGELQPVTIADRVPHGLRPVVIEGGYGITGISVSGGVEAKVLGALGHLPTLPCSRGTWSCTFSGVLEPYEQIEMVVGVVVEPDAKTGEVNEASVFGGGGRAASVSRTLQVGGDGESFGIEDYELAPEEEGGAQDTQAGSHPFQLTTTLMLDQTAESQPVALIKDQHFILPPGLIGNPTPFPHCTMAQFLQQEGTAENKCPTQTVLGAALVTLNDPRFLGLATVSVPVYNVEPTVGEPARLGFLVASTPVLLDTSVRTGGDYGVTVDVGNISQTAGFLSIQLTVWGVPGDARHDSARGWKCIGAVTRKAGECAASKAGHPPPFLSLPASCTGGLQTVVEADWWAQPGVYESVAGGGLPALDACNRLPFSTGIEGAPDGPAGSTPSGLTVHVHVPQDAALNASGLSPSQVRNTTVTLPAGVAIDPSAADGQGVCGEAQIALSRDTVPTCPESSKVATVEIRTPLLPNALIGEVYLAAQDANPFGSLIAMYLVAQDPVSGTLVKLAGEVKLDPVTGQIVSTFLNTPQLPFEDLYLHFFGGGRAPLVTPSLCGAYTTSASILPWSGNEASESSSAFDITSGPNSSPCEDPLLFQPYLTAGTTNIQAGGFTPFTMTVSREDGQQNIKAFKLHMPPGLSGLLTGLPLCGEAQADAGTCSPESLIGETTVSVGEGGNPFSVTGGKVYITGPYEGAPFGVSVVVPAKAGPYDLGTVVVRGRIEVNPIDASLTVTVDGSGPYGVPHILDGIPLEIRHINFTTTRSKFTFNPTNCNPSNVTGSMESTEGSSSPLAVPFQVTNCAILGFKPGFAVSTSGKTSRANGASLSVKLSYPKAPFGSQANIKSVKVDLPKQLPSRLTTLQKACTAAQFQANPAGCPAASIVGHATAITPLIPVPLTGPAYFVSYGGAKFPELVIALQGYGVTLDIHGETFINNAGITSSTFHTVPDAPVGSFQLTLPQGKYSALAANGNLCKSKLVMPTLFVAQNGATVKQNTPITATGCAKKTKKAGKHHKGTSRKKK